MPTRTPHGSALCLSCRHQGRPGDLVCTACGGSELALVADGAVVGLPAGRQPCERCGTDSEPLSFRGSIRLYSVIVIAREKRVGGYVCADCAVRQTAASLAFTGLLGWWGVVSAFIWAPRATYYNWRAVWRHPRKPLAWGALDAETFAASLAPERRDTWTGFGQAAAPAPAFDPSG